MKKNVPLYILFIIFIILSIFDTEKMTNSALNAISLWGNRVFPALFPFLFCTKSLLLLDVAPIFEKLLGWLFELLGFPRQGAYPFLVSVLGGYPAGMTTLKQMTELELLDDDSARALAPLCHTSGPIFVLGYAASITGYSGGMLLLCHLGGVVLCGLVFRLISSGIKTRKRGKVRPASTVSDSPSELKLGKLLVTACNQSISTLLTVGGLIVFFSCLTSSLPLPNTVKALFEMTNGLSMGLNPPFCAFLLSFSGLCIIVQALALGPEKIKPMEFIGCRLISGVFSAIFCAISQACSIFVAALSIAVCCFLVSLGIIWRTGRDCALPARRSLQDRTQAPQERRLHKPWHRDGSPLR